MDYFIYTEDGSRVQVFPEGPIGSDTVHVFGGQRYRFLSMPTYFFAYPTRYDRGRYGHHLRNKGSVNRELTKGQKKAAKALRVKRLRRESIDIEEGLEDTKAERRGAVLYNGRFVRRELKM